LDILPFRVFSSPPQRPVDYPRPRNSDPLGQLCPRRFHPGCVKAVTSGRRPPSRLDDRARRLWLALARAPAGAGGRSALRFHGEKTRPSG